MDKMGNKSKKNIIQETIASDPNKDVFGHCTVKVIIPGLDDPLIFKVRSEDPIHDIKQAVLESQECFFRTCFSLQNSKGMKVDDYSEIGTHAIQNQVVLKLVDNAYNFREVMIHLHRFKEFACNGSNIKSSMYKSGLSSTTVSIMTNIENDQSNLIHSASESIDIDLPSKLSDFYSLFLDKEVCSCVKSFRLSYYNPPLPRFKLTGHILYIDFVTIEDVFIGVTATTNGFYINDSDRNNFIPTWTSEQSFLTVDLLVSSVSPLYRKKIREIHQIASERHLFELVPYHIPVPPWVTLIDSPTEDCFQAIEFVTNISSIDETLFSNTRDWNEELQSFTHLETTTESEVLSRDRYLSKLIRDITLCSRNAAIAVVDGHISPINEVEDERQRMYIWNSLFVCIACDTRNYYRDLGGDIASRVSVRMDIKGVNFLKSLQIPKIHLLGTTVIDYRGHRVVCQSILPGIFTRNVESSVDYGSIDHGKTIFFDSKFDTLAKEISNILKITPHKVFDESGKAFDCYLSLETKGIRGTDNRCYFLDLYKLFPPDIAFLKINIKHLITKNSYKFLDPREIIKEGNFSFPSNYPHNLVCFRQEFIHPLLKLTQTNISISQKDLKENLKNLSIVDYFESKNLKFTYNPDCFNSTECEEQSSNRDMIQSQLCCLALSSYMILNLIPFFLESLICNDFHIFDHDSLTTAMHLKGINIRYLGYMCHLSETKPQFKDFYFLLKMEMISRSAKRILRYLLGSSAKNHHAVVISHFLNCYLGSINKPQLPSIPENMTEKRKIRRGSNSLYKFKWKSLTSYELWEIICVDVQRFYGFKLFSSPQPTLNRRNLNRLGLLRAFCKMTGIQVLCKDYDFKSKKINTFSPENIMGVFPIVTGCSFVYPSHIRHMIDDVTRDISKKDIQKFETTQQNLNTLLTYITQVSGPLTAENADCHSQIASQFSLVGANHQAADFQIKAAIIYERIYGSDDFRVINAINQLAAICSNFNKKFSVNLLMRSRYLLGLFCWPENRLIYENEKDISSHCFDLYQFNIALNYSQRVLNFLQKFDPDNYKSIAAIHQIIGAIHFNLKNFRAAIAEERNALLNFKKFITDEENSTIKSSQNLLKYYVQCVIKTEKVIPIENIAPDPD